MKNKILVIAPHADDEILGCGATIRKHVRNGNLVWVAIMTNATLTDPIKYTQEKLINVRNEALNACKLLGVQDVIFENFPAPGLDQFPGFKIAESISQLIKNLLIDTLYIPHRGDIHKDHKAIFEASMVAARPTGSYSIKNIYCYETLSETEWAFPFAGETFIPTVFESVTLEDFSFKCEAMKIYKSQLRSFPSSRSIEALESLAKLRGSTIGVERAEAFELIRSINN